MFKQHYIFSATDSLPSAIRVAASDLYTSEKGFGFVTEVNRNEQILLQVPEINSGFEPWYWLTHENISLLKESSEGVYITQEANYLSNDWPIPLHFKIQVPAAGNYTISLKLKNIDKVDETVYIFTGRRRLISYLPQVAASSSIHKTFTVNVSDIIPRSKTSVYIDRTLDLTIVSKANIALSELEIVSSSNLPTLYVAGDSTVTDQHTSYPYHAGCSYSGWAQMLPLFLKPGICISNHAHSGLTSETFRSEGHYDIILKAIRPGDFILIQFGHNDQKLPHLSAYGGYTHELARYIHEIREKKAYPILVTPLARNTWRGDGSYNDLLLEYADACIKLSQKENIPLIDLHHTSKLFIKHLGLENSKAYFFPNDYTHTNDYGGVQMASLVATALKNIQPLEAFIVDSIDKASACFCQSIKVMKCPIPPEDYIDLTQDNHTVTFTDIADCDNQDIIIHLASKGIISDRKTLFRPNDYITRAEVLEWVIKAVGFVPMNVYNDYYSDVIGHEWYAGTVEVAHQNGIVDAYLTQDQLFHPLLKVTTEELISFLINSYKCRKQFTANYKNTDYITLNVSPFATIAVKIAIELGLLTPPFDPYAQLTRSQATYYIKKFITLL